MELSWDKYSDIIDGFRLYCSRHRGVYELGKGKELTTLKPTDKGFSLGEYFLLPGVYYFVLTAFNKYGESSPSNEVQLVVH